MLNGNVYYHGIIRKAIVGFGRLFSDIYIDRKLGDSSKGETVQRLHVPLAYAPKEKWLVRVQQDPNLENHTLTTLPRMSFEIIAYTYDSLRKINRLQQVKSPGDSETANFVRTPVPYNMDMSLYIITKTQEDALQILEQILPYFTPEYSLTLKVVDGMDIEMDVPIVLNSIIVSDEFEGDFQTRRFVVHTINFQMKLNLFGAVDKQNVITTAKANVGTDPSGVTIDTHYTATGDALTKEITGENWEDNF
jgi:hypothetical protein